MVMLEGEFRSDFLGSAQQSNLYSKVTGLVNYILEEYKVFFKKDSFTLAEMKTLSNSIQERVGSLMHELKGDESGFSVSLINIIASYTNAADRKLEIYLNGNNKFFKSCEKKIKKFISNVNNNIKS